jgi:hypothetical protein
MYNCTLLPRRKFRNSEGEIVGRPNTEVSCCAAARATSSADLLSTGSAFSPPGSAQGPDPLEAIREVNEAFSERYYGSVIGRGYGPVRSKNREEIGEWLG